MLLSKLRFVAVSCLLVGAVATGAGYWNYSHAMKDEPKGPPATLQPRLAAKPDDTNRRPATGRMFVVGRVLDPAGKEELVKLSDCVENLGGARFPTAHSDPAGRWTAPADGRYLIVVRNVTGGPDDAVNKKALDKVFEYLGRYFPTDRKM